MASPSSLGLNAAGGKALTQHLRRMAAEVCEILPDGTQLTRAEMLAEMIWKQALGWKEESRDEETGNKKVVYHPPVAWAQQFLWERTEGRAPVAESEAGERIKAADKVRELSKQRLNNLTSAALGPPKRKPKAVEGDDAG